MSIKPISILSSILVGLCLLLGPAPAAQAAVTRATYQGDTTKQTNTEKTARDQVALKSNSCLERYAEAQAKAMMTSQTLYHSDLGKVLTACDMSGISENVASGYASGYRTVKGWMGSAGHRENILNSDYRLIGAGAYPDSDGVWWVVEIMAYA